MSEFIVPDQIHRIGIEGGSLDLHIAYDTLHRWQRLGFSMLKYWNQDIEPATMSNIPLDEAGAAFLIEACNIGVVNRTTICDHEHEIYVGWLSDQLEENFDES